MIRNPITGDILPANWKLVSVDEIKSIEKYSCVAGPFGSDISSQYFKEEGVPVIRGNNLSLTNEKFVADGFVFVSRERATNYRAQHVTADDLIFTCWGTIGQVGIIPEDGPYDEYIISNKQLKLRVNEELVNPHFLYYYFSSKAVFQYLNNIAIGSAVPGINLGILKRFPVILPPKTIQDSVGRLLDSFFKLIENNKQRIKLLEEMAEEIYKEWFVRFRFPGYETTRFLNDQGKEVPHGTLEALPEGWDRKEFQFFGKIITGKTPPTGNAQFFNGNIPFIKTPDMNGSIYVIETGESLSEQGAATQSKKFIPKNSLMISCIGSAGVYALASRNCQTNQQINSIVFYEEYYSFYFYSFANKLKELLNNLGSNGATMTNVNKAKFETMKAIYPTTEILISFHKLVESNFELILNLQIKNQLLQQNRDLLLPRLISGKLSVAHLVEEESLAVTAEPAAIYGKRP